MYTLAQLGWTPTLQAQFEAICLPQKKQLIPARISADYGIQYEIITPQGNRRAHHGGARRTDHHNPETIPAVGDWVAVHIDNNNIARIVSILPRHSQLVRQAAGKRAAMQIIGANLDIVFIVTSLNLELNLRRLERYMTAVFDSGATPVLVLTKVDLIDDATAFKKEVNTIAANTTIVITDAINHRGIDKLQEIIAPGITAAFVGSSGVGKSTLINALIGQEAQATAEIRAADNRGRHTTTHRQLLILPTGGIVIDTPGMREFHLWEPSDGLADAFNDIQKFADNCTFRDCKHNTEPGCAVQAAITAGKITPDRLASFQKLSHQSPPHQRRPKSPKKRK